MQKDSTLKTIVVAAILCVVCSVLVSSAAVGLRSKQEENKKLDIKKNLLLASGLIGAKATKEEINQAYTKIQAEVVNLDSGEVMPEMKAEDFDQKAARKDPKMNKKIDSAADKAGIKMRSQYSIVYKVVENDEVKMIVLPINGKGLWSTLYGFIALAPDTKTVQGLGFYEHAETPGLGGEVDNPMWKAQWSGKIALDEEYQPEIRVIKGAVDPNDPEAKHKVDGLSGATITSNGVTGLVNYWLGQDGFGPYLSKFRNEHGVL